MPIELNPCVKCGGVAKRGNWKSNETNLTYAAKMYYCICTECKNNVQTKDGKEQADAAWNAANPKEVTLNDKRDG